MGGFGSGRWGGRSDAKTHVEDCHVFALADLAGPFIDGRDYYLKAAYAFGPTFWMTVRVESSGGAEKLLLFMKQGDAKSRQDVRLGAGLRRAPMDALPNGV